MAGRSRALVINEPLEVATRLRALGLTLEILHGSLQAGLAAAALCTANHPSNFPGLSLWGEAVRWLREMLIPLGWRRDDSFNLPTVVRGDDEMAIAVVRGDVATGNPKGNPSTQYARGTVMIRRVQSNGVLPYDHLPQGYGEEVETEAAAVPTWLLLHYRKGDELVSELSFPIEIDASGFVKAWGERIILKPISLDGGRMRILDEPPVNPDVNVRRRAS
jgi:hypothetical protein